MCCKFNLVASSYELYYNMFFMSNRKMHDRFYVIRGTIDNLLVQHDQVSFERHWIEFMNNWLWCICMNGISLKTVILQAWLIRISSSHLFYNSFIAKSDYMSLPNLISVRWKDAGFIIQWSLIIKCNYSSLTLHVRFWHVWYIPAQTAICALEKK